MDNSCILQVINVSKSFGGVQALKDVSLGFYPGEVHAVVGENGAGKSTLMNIIAGVHKPDTGSVLLEGTDIVDMSIKQRQEIGISMVYQEMNIFPNLSVARNVYASKEPVGLFGKVDEKKMLKDTTELVKELQLDINPTAIVGNLSVAEKQFVQIIIGLSYKSKVIILDEPNTALTDEESAKLFRIIEDLKKRNVAIIYISHRLEQVLKISDKISVLRDGKYIGTLMQAEASIEKLLKMMLGTDIKEIYPSKNTEERRKDEIVLQVQGLSARGAYEDVSFELRKGEILGFAGLQGCGHSELFESIIGVRRTDQGRMILNGKPYKPRNSAEAIAQGVVYVPPERRTDSIIPEKSIAYNIVIANLNAVKNRGMIFEKPVKVRAKEYIERLKIKTSDCQQLILELSGGNQQKAVFARALAAQPDILVLNEPTKGIDVGAKHDIYLLLQSLASAGLSIMVISAELDEIVAISDRVIAFYDGCKIAEYVPDKVEKIEILDAIMGKKGHCKLEPAG